jgi:hypothetical protein
VASGAELLNLTHLTQTNLKNLGNIVGNFKQTLTSSLDLSHPVFYSLVSRPMRYEQSI